MWRQWRKEGGASLIDSEFNKHTAFLKNAHLASHSKRSFILQLNISNSIQIEFNGHACKK